MLNSWHDITCGKNAPGIVNIVIEIPKNSKIKYELDKETGMLKLDRFLHSAVHYPGDYGFIPQTLWDDNDPLDIVVLTGEPVYPMTLAEVRPIGVLRMVDGDEKDDKIVACYRDDPRYKEFNDIKDLPKHIIKELKHFFETYKEIEGKQCKVPSVLGKKEALNDIKRAQKLYKEKFNDKDKRDNK